MYTLTQTIRNGWRTKVNRFNCISKHEAQKWVADDVEIIINNGLGGDFPAEVDHRYLVTDNDALLKTDRNGVLVFTGTDITFSFGDDSIRYQISPAVA